MIFYSIIKSITLLISKKPKIIFGMGGYASFPICIAASILKIKFITYENNLIIGKANKYLLPFCEKMFVSRKEVEGISEKYSKKIIAALTIENKEDVKKYKDYKDISEIILFDSKGYEKSMSFDHDLLNEVDDRIEKMIAGNIKIEDVTNFKNMSWILDVSGNLESSKGVKDINKIDKFLNTVHNISS